MVTIDFSGTRVALPRDAAAAVANELWKGRRSGSATSAAKILAALDGPRDPVAIEPYETDAVRAALRELGLDAAGR